MPERLPTILPAVRAVILHPEDPRKWLLLKRLGKDVTLHWPHHYEPPGGGYDEEEPQDAVVREVWEETGLRVVSLLPIGCSHECTMDIPGSRIFNCIIATTFFHAVVESSEVSVDPQEASGYAWTKWNTQRYWHTPQTEAVRQWLLRNHVSLLTTR